MNVYVINHKGEPLMPCSARKARQLLKLNKAIVISREPFTIKLNYGSSSYKQDIIVGVDTGHNNVGVSVITSNKEIFSYLFELRNDISLKMTKRATYRRTRRCRLRYRKPRFNNRKASTRKNRLPPSIKWKVDAHIRLINMIRYRIPISSLILETGSFDIKKIKDDEENGIVYEDKNSFAYENIRRFILERDKYTCQSGLSGCSKKLEVHHIKFRSKGGSNRISNLTTLCELHHKKLHKGCFEISSVKTPTYKSMTTMNIIRKKLLLYYEQDCYETFGYITKKNRDLVGIEKSHSNDAFIIAKGNTHKRALTQIWIFKSSNNRCLQVNRRGSKPYIRRCRYNIQAKDIIEYNNTLYSAVGIENRGNYCCVIDNGKRRSLNTKKVKIVYKKKSLCIKSPQVPRG